MNSSVESIVPFNQFIDSAQGDHQHGNRGDWLSEIKEKGRIEFYKLGWPSPKFESWRYTNLNKLAKTQFSLPQDMELAKLPYQDILPVDAPKIALVNGKFNRELSDLSTISEGVLVNNFHDMRDEQRALFSRKNPTALPKEGLPIKALNDAILSDVLFIEIMPGWQFDLPLHIVSIGCGDHVGFSSKIFVSAGENCHLDIVESHAGEYGSTYFSSCVSNIDIKAGARLGHYKLQNDTNTSTHLALTQTSIEANAVYDNFVMSVGGILSRNEVRSFIAASGVDCCVNGAYLGTSNQHIDNTTFIEHAAEGSKSREVYKGVLADYAKGVFQGKIFVHPEAQKTDGYQMNRALLLSDNAEIDSKPELEIYADDVRCSHGATVGELEEEHLFYLKARGINAESARRLLVEAYIGEVIDEIKSQSIREALSKLASDLLKKKLFERSNER